MHISINELNSLTNHSKGIKIHIKRLVDLIHNIDKFIIKYNTRSKANKFFKAYIINKKINDFNTNIDIINNAIKFEIYINNLLINQNIQHSNAEMCKLLRKINQDNNTNQLSINQLISKTIGSCNNHFSHKQVVKQRKQTTHTNKYI